MGQAQSVRPQAINGRRYDGPLFGGHYKTDFSLNRQAPVNYNKSLPETPRGVQFGHQPPAWEFYRDSPTWDNTANTRYCSPPSTSQVQAGPVPPRAPTVYYGAHGMRVVNP